MLHNEKELLRRLALSDQEAFAELFNHFQPAIYTIVLRISRSERMAEDIVQDCFLKTWLRREEMKDIANFGAWLHVMAANLTYNALRKTKASNLREERYHYDNPVFTSNESILLEKECFFIIIRYLKMLASLVQWNCNNSFLHRKFFIV